MEVVEKVRQVAEKTGDNGMLQAADWLEDWPMNHFDQRMIQITVFQQRHGHSDLSQ